MEKSQSKKHGWPLWLVVALLIVLVSVWLERRREQHYRPAYDVAVEVPSGDSLHPLRIAVVLEPGLFEIDDEGGIAGLLPERAAALLHGYYYQWLPVADQAEGLSLLRTRRAELFATQRAASEEWDEEDLLRTDPIVSTSYGLIYTNDSTSWSDVLSGSAPVEVYYSSENRDARLILENLHDISYTAITPVEAETPPLEIGLSVVSEEIPYALVKKDLAMRLQERFPSLQVASGISFAMPQVWILREEAEALRDTINARNSRARNEN
jgi:hypothetical protein